jgi:ubiquitin-protein ligase
VFKVPLQLNAGITALFISLTLHQEFPYRVPTVVVLADVVHPMLHTQTCAYQGPALKTWNPQSSIINLLAQITYEFN